MRKWIGKVGITIPGLLLATVLSLWNLPSHNSNFGVWREWVTAVPVPVRDLLLVLSGSLGSWILYVWLKPLFERRKEHEEAGLRGLIPDIEKCIEVCERYLMNETLVANPAQLEVNYLRDKLLTLGIPAKGIDPIEEFGREIFEEQVRYSLRQLKNLLVYARHNDLERAKTLWGLTS